MMSSLITVTAAGADSGEIDTPVEDTLAQLVSPFQAFISFIIY